MNMALNGVVLLGTVATLVAAGAAADEVPSVSMAVSGSEVRATAADDRHSVTLSAGGKDAVRVDLPASESVSEIRMARWMNTGVALAIETCNAETNEFSYFWSTAWVDSSEKQISKPVVDRFLKSKVDYDVVGVVNSQSDSIYITLLRHQRLDDAQGFAGYVYFNNCPVGPLAGVLLPLAVNAQPAKVER